MRKRGAKLSARDLAELIEGIAERVESRDLSFSIQLEIQTASEELLDRRHIEGLKLLNRMGLLQSVEGQEKPHRYELVERTIAKMSPLDPDSDGAALRHLAGEIRGESDEKPRK